MRMIEVFKVTKYETASNIYPDCEDGEEFVKLGEYKKLLDAHLTQNKQLNKSLTEYEDLKVKKTLFGWIRSKMKKEEI
jgi:hypothetical protein